MNKLVLQISGFKCFGNCTFELNKMTLLTGANASGKSSFIQALLLLKVASECEDQTAILSLNDPRYAFDFGYPDTLINNSWKEDDVTISLKDGLVLKFSGDKQSMERKLLVNVDGLVDCETVFAPGFTYFCAERQGPRYEYARSLDNDNCCGCHGENTGNVLSDNWNTKISGDRLFKPTINDALFNIALDEWVGYIFPGILVRIQQVGAKNYQIIVRDNFHNVTTDSTNIGFGISYALPILVGALLANKGGWLIVENPEAHIHAKAQSNMGYFLGVMAAAGLRVVVETHSEHIVNGLRRATIVDGRLRPDDTDIYFFKDRRSIELITIDSQGNLSDFPVDFFDQSRQDMIEIITKVRGCKEV